MIHFWMLPAWFPLGLSFLFCKMEIIPFQGTGLLWSLYKITLMCLDESFYKADLKKHAALIDGFVWSDQDPRITSQDECVCVEPSDNAEHWNNIHVTLLKASTVGAHGRVCCYSFFLFILCKSFFLLIENTNKKRDDQKNKEKGEFCSISPITLIHLEEVFSRTNRLWLSVWF